MRCTKHRYHVRVTTTAELTADVTAEEDVPCGLRERKKRETRKALHHAALRLADEHGADGVTVDAVAAAAGVSTRTFFNYFASKEDALVGGNAELVDETAARMLARPEDEPVRESVRAAVLDYLAVILRDPEISDVRRRIIASDPVTGTRILGVGVRLDHALVDTAVERARRTTPPGEDPRAAEFEASVVAYAALGAIRGAVRAHVRSSTERPLTELVDDAYALLGW